MASWQSGVANILLNTFLVVGGLATMILLYALVGRTVFSPPDPQRSRDTTDLVGSVIQVEVQNGVGVDDLAVQTMHYLRDRGFDVVDVGNYSSFDQEHTVVIDRIGNMDAARKVAEILGVPAERVRQEIRRQYYLDVSIIIGRDYEQLRPFHP